MTTPAKDDLVPVFVPLLSAVLLAAEDAKGEPLTYDEVIRMRDSGACIMMTVADARKLEEKRGRDIDPENCWFDWQQLRQSLGRKPEIDPGPLLQGIRSSDPLYLATIREAHASLDQFRAMLPADGSPCGNALVKTEVRQGDHKVFLWLMNARSSGSSFIAEFFEVPVVFSGYEVGDALEVSEAALLDWMINDDGTLYGGFSIRYYRATLPESERAEYDRYIGVTRFS